MCAAVQRIREMGVAPAAGPCHCGGIFARSARGGALATAAVDWCNRPSATEVEIGPLPAPRRATQLTDAQRSEPRTKRRWNAHNITSWCALLVSSMATLADGSSAAS